MKLEACATYDNKTLAYSPPFFVRTVAVAVRWWRVRIKDDENSDLHKAPQDFNLIHLGHFDDETGEFHNIETGPVVIETGTQAVAQIEQEVKDEIRKIDQISR